MGLLSCLNVKILSEFEEHQGSGISMEELEFSVKGVLKGGLCYVGRGEGVMEDCVFNIV